MGGRDFPTRPDRRWGSPRMDAGFFPKIERPGHGVYHPPPYSAEVKERIELYLYSLSGPLWPVLGRNLPLPLPLLHCSFDSPAPDYSSCRFLPADDSRSFPCWLRNSAEVHISVCTRVFLSLPFFFSSAFFVYSCVLLCNLSSILT